MSVLRKELNDVKKKAKEVARKVAIKIPHFKDCKYHKGDKKRGDESTIFITEGPSAAGSMVAARDVETQAIFGLKGVPLNVFGKTKAAIYKNEELYNLMTALGIEDSVENLRFNNVVIATDADYDGFHIRNLLMTFFLNYFEELVTSGHVYILETPIFRVRNSRETRYCYSEKERNQAVDDLRNPEVTRFKGLGEISPGESWTVYRRGYAPDQSRRARARRGFKYPRILYGKEYARPQRLYCGAFDINPQMDADGRRLNVAQAARGGNQWRRTTSPMSNIGRCSRGIVWRSCGDLMTPVLT